MGTEKKCNFRVYELLFILRVYLIFEKRLKYHLLTINETK